MIFSCWEFDELIDIILIFMWSVLELISPAKHKNKKVLCSSESVINIFILLHASDLGLLFFFNLNYENNYKMLM